MNRDTRRPAVYIMASRRNGTLYTGVTSDLIGRVHQHRSGTSGGFAGRYGCALLVWFEVHDDMVAAITREKQIKGGSRAGKLALIEKDNSGWLDLYATLVPSAPPMMPRRDHWVASLRSQ